MKNNNNLCFIGNNPEDIIKDLCLDEKDKNYIKNWVFYSYTLKDINNEGESRAIAEAVLNSLEIEINKAYSSDLDEIFSFTIIYSLYDFNATVNENEKNFVKNLFDGIVNQITSNFYLPFFIFLAKNEQEKKEFNKFLKSDEIEKINIDQRNISCFILSEEDELINKKIMKIFAYYFEKGDIFELDNKIIKLYKEPKEGLFSINILILGKTQVGKSTFINTLLKEKKAKEGGAGSPATNEQISYHVDGIPLIINDIEGFTGEETIKKVIKKIESMQKNLGEKELHLVIYIIDYNGPTYFNENEYMIFEQLANKTDITQFLFICSKSEEENDEKTFQNIKKSFFNMIKKGLKKEKKAKRNILNVLDYLYYCQKKDIDYNEVKTNIDQKSFYAMNFFEKLDLKFNNTLEEDKSKEMTGSIIEKDKTFIFLNLLLDKNHKKIFGMNKVSEKIRFALNYIKKNNIKFFNDEIKLNKEKIENLKEKINFHQKKLNLNLDIKNFIDNDDNNNVNSINNIENLDESVHDSKKLENMNEEYNELINCINKMKISKAREFAEKIKNDKIKEIEKELKWHKGFAYASGIFPLIDIYIQYKIKKNAKIKIANKFKDNLIDFKEKDIKSQEKDKDSINDIKKKSNDVMSDILKSIGRGISIGINIIAKSLMIPITGIGILIGVLTGGLVMNYDIKSYLNFYGKRYLYKCFVNLSFDSIEKYLKKNFEE